MSEKKGNEGLKSAEAPAAGAGQPEKVGEDKIAEAKKILAEQGVDVDKLKVDNENYKTALLAKKADEFKLSEEKAEAVPAPVETPAEEDWQKEARRIADNALNARTQVEEKFNEKIAVRKFVQAHPEVSETIWSLIRGEYARKNGTSVDGFLEDLERAYKYVKLEQQASAPAVIAPKAAVTPTGAGAANVLPDQLTERQLEIVNNPAFGLNVETFKKWRAEVLAGRRSVPDDVMRILSE